MRSVKRGGDRQALHERVRQHSVAAGQRIKGEGLPSDLLDRIDKVPHLRKPFDDAGAGSNENVRHAQDSLINTLESALTRGFRSAFGLAWPGCSISYALRSAWTAMHCARGFA